tara:strand:- start:502 stop:624 length:123 start_codon:yes stop_codon:yes gene_type:complete
MGDFEGGLLIGLLVGSFAMGIYIGNKNMDLQEQYYSEEEE